MESPRLQIHAPKSCANHAAGSRLHVPQIKRRYTHRGWTQAAVRTAGSTILRAAPSGRSGKSGGPAHGPWHGPPAPARKSKSTVRRGARGRRIFYAVAGAVACSVQSRGCPHVLTLVSRHARFSHVRSPPCPYVVEYIRIKRHVSTPLISYGMNHEPLSFSNDA